MIDGVSTIRADQHGAAIRNETGIQAADGFQHTGIPLLVIEEMLSAGSDIGDFHLHGSREFALHVEVPLMGSGILEVTVNTPNRVGRIGFGSDGCNRIQGVLQSTVSAADDGSASGIRECAGGVVADVGEEGVVVHAPAATNHGLVLTHHTLPETRSVGEAEAGTEIVASGFHFMPLKERVGHEGPASQ